MKHSPVLLVLSLALLCCLWASAEAHGQLAWTVDESLPKLTRLSREELARVEGGDARLWIRLLCQPGTKEYFASRVNQRRYRRAAMLMLYMLGDDQFEEELKREQARKQDTLEIALALAYRGSEAMMTLALREHGEATQALQQRAQMSEREQHREYWRITEAGWILCRLGCESPFPRVLAALSDPDISVRRGAFSVLLLDYSNAYGPLPPDASSSRGYDYRLDAEANREAIAMWRQVCAKELADTSFVKQHENIRRDAFDLPTEEEEVEIRAKEQAKEQAKVLDQMAAQMRAAESDEEKRRIGDAIVEYNRTVRGMSAFHAWINYPGSGPRPAPDIEVRQEEVGFNTYSIKWGRRMELAIARGDQEGTSEADSKRIDGHFRREKAVAEGHAHREELRAVLHTGSAELSDEDLHYATILVAYGDSALAATTYELYSSDRRNMNFQVFRDSTIPPPRSEIQQTMDDLKARYRAARAKYLAAPPDAPPQPEPPPPHDQQEEPPQP